MKSVNLLFLFLIFRSLLFSQDSLQECHFEAGIRCKKFAGFYWENGVSAEFSSQKILNNKIQFGFNLVSSRLGSAIGSNAIPTLETELSVIKYFRYNKLFQPLVRLNIGYAHANYGNAMFDNLPRNGALLSFETGLSYKLKIAKEEIRYVPAKTEDVIESMNKCTEKYGKAMQKLADSASCED